MLARVEVVELIIWKSFAVAKTLEISLVIFSHEELQLQTKILDNEQ
jgi:hypothetical protein